MFRLTMTLESGKLIEGEYRSYISAVHAGNDYIELAKKCNLEKVVHVAVAIRGE